MIAIIIMTIIIITRITKIVDNKEEKLWLNLNSTHSSFSNTLLT